MTNLELMRKRLEWQGGIKQEDRMIKEKWRTLQKALKYSYQGCSVVKIQPFAAVLGQQLPDTMGSEGVRALINPDKVKQDYDDKILSIDYAHNFEPGDVFEWLKTGTQWLIYTQEITEDAYFRGEIRRCRHIIKFKDEAGNICSTYAAIRGPVETQINSIQKHQIRVDKPNLSLNILMPQNETTLAAFERYQEFLFAGRCWRVEALDSISMKNVLEIAAEEYYIDKSTDDVEAEIKNGLVIEPIDPTPNAEIKGETFIKPSVIEKYTVDISGGIWFLPDDTPACIVDCNDTEVSIKWNKMTSGQFDLEWRKDDLVYKKTIVVESLF